MGPSLGIHSLLLEWDSIRKKGCSDYLKHNKVNGVSPPLTFTAYGLHPHNPEKGGGPGSRCWKRLGQSLSITIYKRQPFPYFFNGKQPPSAAAKSPLGASPRQTFFTSIRQKRYALENSFMFHITIYEAVTLNMKTVQLPHSPESQGSSSSNLAWLQQWRRFLQ